MKFHFLLKNHFVLCYRQVQQKIFNNLILNHNCPGQLRSWGTVIEQVWNTDVQKGRGLCVWFGTTEVFNKEAVSQISLKVFRW